MAPLHRYVMSIMVTDIVTIAVLANPHSAAGCSWCEASARTEPKIGKACVFGLELQPLRSSGGENARRCHS